MTSHHHEKLTTASADPWVDEDRSPPAAADGRPPLTVKPVWFITESPVASPVRGPTNDAVPSHASAATPVSSPPVIENYPKEREQVVKDNIADTNMEFQLMLFIQNMPSDLIFLRRAATLADNGPLG